MLDDAARLFKESGRFDYLNRLYQSAGIWNKAIKVCVYVCVMSLHLIELFNDVRAVQCCCNGHEVFKWRLQPDTRISISSFLVLNDLAFCKSIPYQ